MVPRAHWFDARGGTDSRLGSPVQSKPKLLQLLWSNLRLRHFSPRTEEASTWWVRRFVRYHGVRHPAEMGEAEVRGFLIHLAEERHLGASSLNQALAALLFLYAEVLRRPVGVLGRLPRAKQPTRLPVVLTVEEVRRVLAELQGVWRLIGLVLYGSGARLLECLSLRVKDVDLARGELMIRRGKGAKRATPGQPNPRLLPPGSSTRRPPPEYVWAGRRRPPQVPAADLHGVRQLSIVVGPRGLPGPRPEPACR